MGQFSFITIEDQIDKLHVINDFLYRLNSMIDWNIFYSLLITVRSYDRKSNAGRPPFDVLLMFKILILKNIYNLSDEQVEFQIRDRITNVL
jgi:hypothetical protein